MTRHNFGWMVCDRFFGDDRTIVWTEKFNALYREVGTGDTKTFFIKPTTYMNECGRSIQALLAFFKIPPSELLVVHDDLELPFGRIAVKRGGGTAGHNGLRSIKQHLGTGEFKRLRLGIGRPSRMTVSAYVLSRFTGEEEADLPGLCDEARNLLEKMIQEKKGSYHV